MSLNIEQIKISLFNEKIRVVFLFILFMLNYSCKEMKKTESTNKETVYKDSFLYVSVDDRIKFPDSFQVMNDRIGKDSTLYNFMYEDAPCVIDNDTLKFIVSSALINNIPIYSITSYYISSFKKSYFHKTHFSADVALDYGNNKTQRSPCELVLNKISYSIGDTLIGMLIQKNNSDYLTINYKPDTICFKYKILPKDSISSNRYLKNIKYYN
ncbi:MAG: hypothetical protein IT271_04275 [Chitinophagales bacterium]|nr:hypothetical protein [Chitinophagales bacterium]